MSDSSPLVLVIEPEQPFAIVQLMTAIIWPRDAAKRNASLAAFGADGLDRLEDTGLARARQEVEASLAVAAQANGCTLDEIKSFPEFREEIRRMERYLMEAAEADITNGLYAAGGGRRTLKAAPPLDALQAEWRRVWGSTSRITSLALVLVASMSKHHPELSASLTRAWAVMAVDEAAGRYKAPSDRSVLMNVWKEFGEAAPYSAAFMLWGMMMKASPLESDAVDLVSLARSPEAVATILSWAGWLRHRAATTKALRASSMLLDPGESLLIVSSVPAREPPLPRLSAMQIAAAAAPQKSFDPDAIARAHGRSKSGR
jgi:hypothetical protein